MADSTRLTWHAGSVLPYASLWHTVQRVCALNCLRSRELPHPAARALGNRFLLDNRGDSVDVAALAKWIGEPSAVFRWAHLGAVPSWVRAALVTSNPRVCLSCLAAGYHAALFSVRLLDVCPIHGAPLLDRCHCGRPFCATLEPADFHRAGSCACGRLRFFTQESCRRPTLEGRLTHALDPAAAWLEALSRLARPEAIDRSSPRQASICINQITSWCAVLGLDYPTCFRSLPQQPARYVVVNRSTRLSHRARSSTTTTPVDGTFSDYSFWSGTPATWVYRAMARHLRRHVAPGTARWVTRFMTSADPLVIGEMLRTDRRAALAFTEMLWALDIEPNLHNRRWPYRRPPVGTVGCLSEHLIAYCNVHGPDHPKLNSLDRQWLEYHAAGAAMLAVWHEARARATASIHSGIAVWERGPLDEAGPCDWWAALRPDSSVHFLAPAFDGHDLQAPPRPDKRARCAEFARLQTGRHQAMLAMFQGACLTWSADDGWCVVDAVPPEEDSVRRHRLLGLPGRRPWFLLYRALDGRIVARLGVLRLQVIENTPHGAIAALRQCVQDYARVCAAVVPPDHPAAAQVQPCPVDTGLASDYWDFVATVRVTVGFWRGAGTLASAARCYASARSTTLCPAADIDEHNIS